MKRFLLKLTLLVALLAKVTSASAQYDPAVSVHLYTSGGNIMLTLDGGPAINLGAIPTSTRPVVFTGHMDHRVSGMTMVSYLGGTFAKFFDPFGGGEIDNVMEVSFDGPTGVFYSWTIGNYTETAGAGSYSLPVTSMGSNDVTFNYTTTADTIVDRFNHYYTYAGVLWGTKSVAAQVAVNDAVFGVGPFSGTSVSAFPQLTAGTSPNRYAYPGQPLKIQVDAADSLGGITKAGYVIPPATFLNVNYSSPLAVASEAFDQPAFTTSTRIRGRSVFGALGYIESADIQVNVMQLQPAPLDPSDQQVADWPEAPTGATDKPWKIAADYHHLNGEKTTTIDYGLEFEEHQYRQQLWQWIDPATGAPSLSVAGPFVLPQETIPEPDGPVPLWTKGPMHQNEVRRWTPGVRPVVPVASATDLEINAGDTLPVSAVSPSWDNPWSVAQRPDSWPAWATYTAAQIRRAATIVPPAGTTTISLLRSQDGYAWTGPVTSMTALPAGTWRATATYRPALGEFYLPTTQEFTVTVRPALVVKATNASVEYSIDSGVTWSPWPTNASAWEKPAVYTQTTYANPWVLSIGGIVTTVPEIRLRATPALNYAWGTDWFDPQNGPVWYNTRSAGPLDTDANFASMQATMGQFNAPISIPMAINATTMEAVGMQVPPRMTLIRINDVPDASNPTDYRKRRSSTVGTVSPWAYIARSGVEFRLQGQSRESGINGFEAYALPPKLDASVESNWQKLDTTLVSTPPVPNTALPSIPMQLADQTYSVELGKTRLETGVTGSGSKLIPADAYINLAGWPDDVNNTNVWQIRVRCRSTVLTWSPWQTYQVYAVLPLRPEVITTQNMAPPAPAGAAQWFQASAPTSETVYIWLP